MMDPTGNANGMGKQPHTLASILPEMEAACAELEAEMKELDEEEERLLQEVQGTIGGLSDLRYGKFAPIIGGGEVRDEVLERLKGLREVCTRQVEMIDK
jgi:centromere-localized protein 2